jgi:hypothetical protein
MSLDLDDLPCHYALHPLCQCVVQARQGVVPSELECGYFYGNIVGEDDAWVGSLTQAFIVSLLYVRLPSWMTNFVLNFSRQYTRTCDWETFKGHKEFLEQVRRKGDKLGNMMVYERKQ